MAGEHGVAEEALANYDAAIEREKQLATVGAIVRALHTNKVNFTLFANKE